MLVLRVEDRCARLLHAQDRRSRAGERSQVLARSWALLLLRPHRRRSRAGSGPPDSSDVAPGGILRQAIPARGRARAGQAVDRAVARPLPRVARLRLPPHRRSRAHDRGARAIRDGVAPHHGSRSGPDQGDHGACVRPSGMSDPRERTTRGVAARGAVLFALDVGFARRSPAALPGAHRRVESGRGLPEAGTLPEGHGYDVLLRKSSRRHLLHAHALLQAGSAREPAADLDPSIRGRATGRWQPVHQQLMGRLRSLRRCQRAVRRSTSRPSPKRRLRPTRPGALSHRRRVVPGTAPRARPMRVLDVPVFLEDWSGPTELEERATGQGLRGPGLRDQEQDRIPEPCGRSTCAS